MNTNFLPVLPDGSKILSFTGRLILEKGIPEAIEAVKLCNTKYGHPEIHLMVAGDGPLINECISCKTANIHLLGKLSFEQIVSLLSNSISLLLPSSYSEGFPTSVLEAVACRTYVIMTPVSGAKEILPDDSYGTVTQKRPSADDIAKEMLDILYDDKRRMEATEKAYKRLVDNFTWKNTADKLLELL
ncbi:glycosyltransferase family 4 protein [Treponema sp.]|uniref:glycosyltransferase family 4 protein n=1 Tax=Treponema sp. TaxID=166 RepID=UPI0025EA328B|nr:glycosyltransferase family 4 protein [Treponema sp.]MCR5217571.1 glycosyltransferase family 4 protein [Treponema sp.]